MENTKFTMVEITVFLLNMLEVDKAVFDGKKEESFCVTTLITKMKQQLDCNRFQIQSLLNSCKNKRDRKLSDLIPIK
ncbi:hypothetical protein RCG17_11370 [Neobacillus sp. PS3-12]|uniref:hypothetical protein n=1 Tax=Neobacillus sp. PS3-12 TaxID=3070677 RepID=UPI0027E1A7C3|nr:hypothetical protein [Neobacillus sp. PS3-12]WML55130.1 hypothetical protein RCG17_11370 [Neobacillus sp. PS3-12]